MPSLLGASRESGNTLYRGLVGSRVSREQGSKLYKDYLIYMYIVIIFLYSLLSTSRLGQMEYWKLLYIT